MHGIADDIDHRSVLCKDLNSFANLLALLETMTHQDLSISEWIDLVHQMNPHRLREYVADQSFEVVCHNDQQAMIIHRKFEELGLSKTHVLRLERGDGRLFNPNLILNNRRHSLSRIETMPTDLSGMLCNLKQSPELTQYLKRTTDLIKATQFIYRANSDLTLEGVIPDITEARLNMPIKDQLGKSINVLNEKMASRRRPAIQQAIESGEVKQTTYDFIWESRRWDFIETYQYFPATDGGIGHVIITVMDPDSPRGWEQRAHFHRMIEDGLALPTPKIILP